MNHHTTCPGLKVTHRPGEPWTLPKLRAIVAYREQTGVSLAKISRHYGMRSSALSKVIGKVGIRVKRMPPGRTTSYPEEVLQLAVGLRNTTDLSWAEIVERAEAGCTPAGLSAACHRWSKRTGIKMRRGERPQGRCRLSADVKASMVREAHRLRQDGVPWVEVADRVGWPLAVSSLRSAVRRSRAKG